MNENYDDFHHRKTRRTFIYTKSKKLGNILYTNSPTLFTKLDNFRYVFIFKKPYTWRSGIFMNFWSWHLYTKSMTLCVMWRFYIQKARHFARSKTICDTFLYTKSGTFALRNFSLNFWNLRRGRGHRCFVASNQSSRMIDRQRKFPHLKKVLSQIPNTKTNMMICI